MRQDGSSPRVRGTRPELDRISLGGRFIPAGAGNAQSQSSAGGLAAVHPRGCGERVNDHGSKFNHAGSSPRVRGTRLMNDCNHVPQRFIPAGAGNAITAYPCLALRTVHPRGCGERLRNRQITRLVNGSSPRVRGTRSYSLHPALRERFIPAGAGNAPSWSLSSALASVHPRGCGERAERWRPCVAHCGSSPRVRGTRARARSRPPNRRFIPAGAGNAADDLSDRASGAVHPRGCGERSCSVATPTPLGGSSPRVRGTLRLRSTSKPRRRFIPAGAGNAISRCSAMMERAVHPRGCGERSAEFCGSARTVGSSPRVRGTRR